ncbi:MAG: hypothetical protein QGH51_03185 [Planctomycetota bacterium]|nr:hypothetical protein [Planctomycetota bacterium]
MSSVQIPLIALAINFALGFAQTSLAQSYENQKLLPINGNMGQEFGSATSIDNGILAVGSRHDDDLGAESGSAYLFNVSNGNQLAKLLAADGASGDKFGTSVAIFGNKVAVGAPADDDMGPDSGSVYVFDSNSGLQLAKLTAPDGDDGDNFGCSVAVGSGRIVVGSMYDDDHGRNSGAIYIYDSQSFALVTKATPNDAAADDLFGQSVDFDGGVIVAGAHGDDDNGPLSGSAYLFSASNGNQTDKLLANDGSSWDFFGASVAIDSGVVAIGAWADRPHGDNSGSAYLFNVSSGNQMHKLIPPDGDFHDRFGMSVAIDSGQLVVGAEGNDELSVYECGSLYLYDVSSGSLTTRYLASDAQPLDEMGSARSLAIENGTVAAGVSADDDLGNASGSVYLFGNGGGAHFLLSTSGSPGGTVTFTVENATPGAPLGLFYAFGAGNHPAVNPLTGNTIVTGLSAYRFTLGQVLGANGSGMASYSTNVPSIAGGLVYVQAIDALSEQTTNVLGL